MMPAQPPVILFVDDEANAGKYFARAFKRDFTVITTQSADEAEAVLQKQGDGIAILVTDQRMPRRSGTDLLRYCRDHYPHIIRILTTAYAALDDAITAVNSGEIFRYIVKPWDMEKFDLAIREASALYLQKEREKERLREKRQTALSIGGHIAHELRTPLSSIEMGIGGINRYLPELITGYAIAKKNKLLQDTISETRLNRLGEVLTRVNNSVRTAHTTIDMLLANIRNPNDIKAQFDWFTMQNTLDIALERYPFPAGSKDWITCNDTDFTCFGSRELMIQVLHNLIKNSLDALVTCPDIKPEIRIVLEAGPPGQNHTLSFIDNGPGIDENDISEIFEDFFTTKEITSGNGLGLGFSRRVIRAFDGELTCTSEKGRFTQFNISLPNLRSADPTISEIAV